MMASQILASSSPSRSLFICALLAVCGAQEVVRCLHTEPADGFFQARDDTALADMIFATRTPTEADAINVTGLVRGFNVEIMDTIAQKRGWRVEYFQLNDPAWPKSLGKGLAPIWTQNLSSFDCNVNSELVHPSPYQYVDFMIPTIPYGFIVVGPTPKTSEVEFFDQVFEFARPFTPPVWCLIAVFVLGSGFVVCILEGRTEAALQMKQDAEEGRVQLFFSQLVNHTYIAAVEMCGAAAFELESTGGKLFALIYGFVVLLLVSAYTANLASFLISTSQPVQMLTNVHDFNKLGIPACYGSQGHRAWLVENYPEITFEYVDKSLGMTELIDTARKGIKCGGVISTDIHMRYTLATDQKCDMQLLGFPLNMGYYSIPFQKGTPRRDRILRGANEAFMEIISDGTLDAIVESYFPTDPLASIPACNVSPPPAPTMQLGIADMGGIFLVAATGTIVVLIIHFLGPFFQHDKYSSLKETIGVTHETQLDRIEKLLSAAVARDNEERREGGPDIPIQTQNPMGQVNE